MKNERNDEEKPILSDKVEADNKLLPKVGTRVVQSLFILYFQVLRPLRGLASSVALRLCFSSRKALQRETWQEGKEEEMESSARLADMQEPADREPLRSMLGIAIKQSSS